MFSFPFYLAFVTFPRASLKLSRLTLWITSSGRHTLELTQASCFTIGNKSKGLENIQHQITTQQVGREVYTIVFNREMGKKAFKSVSKIWSAPCHPTDCIQPQSINKTKNRLQEYFPI